MAADAVCGQVKQPGVVHVEFLGLSVLNQGGVAARPKYLESEIPPAKGCARYRPWLQWWRGRELKHPDTRIFSPRPKQYNLLNISHFGHMDCGIFEE
jgi:hypothetical protein